MFIKDLWGRVMLEKYQGILEMIDPDEAATEAGPK
jgi:hypothetical protein